MLLPQNIIFEVAFVVVLSQRTSVWQFHPTRTAVYFRDKAKRVLKTWQDIDVVRVEESFDVVPQSFTCTGVPTRTYAYSHGDQGGEGSFDYDIHKIIPPRHWYCFAKMLHFDAWDVWLDFNFLFSLFSSLLALLHQWRMALRACSIGVACWEARSVAAVLFLKSSKLCSGGRSNHFGFSRVISQ